MAATDPQAMEMAAYDMSAWRCWDREHHARPHDVPVEDCPICRWGCQVAGCECRAAIRVISVPMLDTGIGREVGFLNGRRDG